MNTWAEAKFGGVQPPTNGVKTSNEETFPQAVPKECKYNHLYRSFDIFVIDSLFGGISCHAVNRDLDLRIEEHHPHSEMFHGAPVARFAMRRKVDELIESRGLDIPPHVEKIPKQEESATEISRRIHLKELERQRIKRMNKVFAFDACSGIQAGAIFFTATIKLNDIADMFNIDISKLQQIERYQRIPSGARINGLVSYMKINQETYILPSLTCSIEGEYEFEQYGPRTKAGVLTLKAETELHLIDGGHRRGAIEKVVKELAKLGEEDIAVKFVIDRGLRQRRQWFSDTNRFAKTPPKSLCLDYDRRDREANFHRDVIDDIPAFAKYTERTKGSAGGKSSQNLFVLTWLHSANQILRPNQDYQTDFNYCTAFWTALSEIIDWRDYDPASPSSPSPEKMREKLCCTAIVIKALAQIGQEMAYQFSEKLDSIKEFLKPLETIDWSKSNPDWEGIAIEKVGDKYKVLTKNMPQIVAYLKWKLNQGGSKAPMSQQESEWVAKLSVPVADEPEPIKSEPAPSEPAKSKRNSNSSNTNKPKTSTSKAQPSATAKTNKKSTANRS